MPTNCCQIDLERETLQHGKQRKHNLTEDQQFLLGDAEHNRISDDDHGAATREHWRPLR